MATKTQTKHQQKYAGFISLVEGVAEELFTKDEWLEAEQDDGLQLEHFGMLSEVYSTAFERDPEAFAGIQTISSDYGLPAWVRPGVEWDAASS